MRVSQKEKAILIGVYTHRRMNRDQIWQLFFIKPNGQLTDIRRANQVLFEMVNKKRLLSCKKQSVVFGSGQMVYEVGTIGTRYLASEFGVHTKSTDVPEEEAQEIVDFYISLKKGLEQNTGQIIKWLGEKQCSFTFNALGRKVKVIQDSFCWWKVDKSHGAFFLEWERGFHELPDIADKFERYELYYGKRAYLEQIGDVGVVPRLVFVFSKATDRKSIHAWLQRQKEMGRFKHLPTVLLGTRGEAITQPLAPIWLKPDSTNPSWLCQ